MTAIVYKNGVMASDTQETVNDVPRRCVKLYKVGKDVIGTAGNSYTGMMFVDWWKNGAQADDKPDLTNLDVDEEDFECLVWTKGKLYSVTRLFQLVEINLEDHPYYAIGSGSAVAYGALAMGASAKRAVEIACDYDISCGLPVETKRCLEED